MVTKFTTSEPEEEALHIKWPPKVRTFNPDASDDELDIFTLSIIS